MKIKKISEVLGKRVFTDSGEFFGEIEEANLFENKIDGWRIKVGGGVASLIGGARGVIIPHNFVNLSVIFINWAHHGFKILVHHSFKDIFIHSF